MTNDNLIELLKTTRDTAATLNNLLNEQHAELLEIKQIFVDYLIFMQKEIGKLQEEQS